jgi:DNA-binding NarL/FixJ family response regulator
MPEPEPTETPLTLVVVDDHELFSAGLEFVLNAASGGAVRVLASTADASQAVALVRRHTPAVAIIDLSMPPPGGLEAIRQVRRNHPQVRILALSGTDDLEFAMGALKAGADGFLLKSSSPEALVPPLQALARGVSVMPRSMMDALVRLGARPGHEALDKLSADELELWRLLAKGCETSQIADQLFASERTVKRMVASLLRKIGAASRLEAAALAGRSGLLDDDTTPALPTVHPDAHANRSQA